MNGLEQSPHFNEMPDFGLEAFGMSEDFDINAAFQEAIQGVASDTELALEEKVRRMEVIVTESSSEVYRDFVDFRQMAAQMEMMCSHDHALNKSVQGNNTLSDLLDTHGSDAEHDHGDHGEFETDPITGKKKKRKKRRGWFGVYM